MKKKGVLFAFITVSLIGNLIYGQTTDEKLNQTYWTMRNRFRKYFISIGSNQGQSIPMAQRQAPGDRCTSDKPNSAGCVYWGDATGYLGDYMCTLATEYALLVAEGKSTTATLNELYYAINAIDRLDGGAERVFDIVQPPDQFNGFFLRDDVVQSTVQKWNDEYPGSYDTWLNYQCLDASRSGNFDKAGGPHGNSAVNEAGFDQIVTIFQGFKFIKKYVPNVYVKPTATDAGFYLLDKVKEITERIMDYMSANDVSLLRADQDTEYLYSQQSPSSYLFASPGLGGTVYAISQCADNDVRGNWILMNPVTNRKVGASSSDTKNQDIRPFAYPLAKIGEQLTGNSYMGREIHHKIVDQAGDGYWCLDAHDYHIPLSWTKEHVWDVLEGFPAINDELIVSFFEVNVQKNPVCFKINPKDYIVDLSSLGRNMYLMEALGALSGTWSHTNVSKFANQYNHENMDLVYSCLNDKTPNNSKSHYTTLLSKLNCNGPHNYGSSDFTSFWNNGNSFEHPTNDNINPDSYYFGDYNANDWMWLYNMYRLKFGDSSFPEYDDNSCNCKKSPAIETNTNPNTLELSQSVTVKRIFSDYLKYGISLKEYITQVLYINNKTLTNKTELVICEGDVTVGTNGIFKNSNSLINDSVKTIVNTNSSLTVLANGLIDIGNNTKLICKKASILEALGNNATIIVRTGSKLIIEPGANFYLRNGSKLIVEDGGQVIIQGKIDPSGTSGTYGKLTYNQGAQIQLNGDNAVLEFNGQLYIGNNAQFTFNYTGNNSGYIKFNRGNTWWDNYAPGNAMISCGSGASFKLNGQNKNDKVMEINQQDVHMPDQLSVMTITKGKVEFNAANAMLSVPVKCVFDKTWFKGNPTFVQGGQKTRGVVVYGTILQNFTNCDFEDLGYGIQAALFYGGYDLNQVKNCTFTRCNQGLTVMDHGMNIRNNDFINNQYAVAGYIGGNSTIQNNTINSTGTYQYNTYGVILSGDPVTLYMQANSIQHQYRGMLISGDMEAKLRCTGITNNNLAYYGEAGSKLNTSTLLGGGFVNGGSNDQFAHFEEAWYWETEQGANNFSINNSSPCQQVISGGPGHPVYTVCPTISDGTIINPVTPFNPTTGNCELVGTANYWRLPNGHPLEYDYNKLSKLTVSNGNNMITPAVMIDATPLNMAPLPCQGNGGGQNNGGGGQQAFIHPLADNSPSSSITTTSFYNKKLSKALTFSVDKMDNLDDTTKVNKAANLLTEILKYNYQAPLTNYADKYLLELAYQKLFSCVAQLTQVYKPWIDSLGQAPAGLQARYTDLLQIINLRQVRKSSADVDYKEVNDLMLLDKAMVYLLKEDRTSALSAINAIIQSNPKTAHRYLYEYWNCVIANEQQALQHTISVTDALRNINDCREKYNSGSLAGNNTRKATAGSSENQVAFAGDYAIAVFPNPAGQELHVSYDLKGFNQITFTIYDIHGREMRQYELSSDAKEMSLRNLNLENGVYLYRITGDGKILMNKKIVIAN
ncbi:MAG: T9SS type A sorting domain-containing protein [Bacteroidetes bacterium]|nr:T9SS type A sorting domain-containing protein [Bacteroidota bacterium]